MGILRLSSATDLRFWVTTNFIMSIDQFKAVFPDLPVPKCFLIKQIIILYTHPELR